MKKHAMRVNPLARPEKQAVQKQLPYTVAELLLDFARSGHVVTRADLPMMVAAVRQVLTNEALRLRRAEP